MRAIRTPLSFEEGKIAEVSDLDTIIKQRITDVLVTSPGERPMRPEYGAGVYNLLFDYPDPLTFADFKTDALMDISENVSGAVIIDLNVAPASEVYDETTMTVEASYQIPPSSVKSVNIVIGEPVLSEDEFF